MTRLIKTTIACIACATAICSCGKQHKAETVVAAFLDNNLETDRYSVSFAGIDSTRHVSDSVVKVMRDNAGNNKMYKKGIKYAPTERQYIYLQAKICVGKDTTQQTFYINPALTQVVAFK